MLKRIEELLSQTLKGERYYQPTLPEYDRNDLFLSPMMMSAKRSKDFILSQPPRAGRESGTDRIFSVFRRRGSGGYFQPERT